MTKEPTCTEIINAINGDYIIQSSELSRITNKTIDNVNFAFAVYQILPCQFPKKSISARAHQIEIVIHLDNELDIWLYSNAFAVSKLVVISPAVLMCSNNTVVFEVRRFKGVERDRQVFQSVKIRIEHIGRLDTDEICKAFGLVSLTTENEKE